MMTPQQMATQLIDEWLQNHTLTGDTGNPADLTQVLADHGLLAQEWEWSVLFNDADGDWVIVHNFTAGEDWTSRAEALELKEALSFAHPGCVTRLVKRPYHLPHEHKEDCHG